MPTTATALSGVPAATLTRRCSLTFTFYSEGSRYGVSLMPATNLRSFFGVVIRIRSWNIDISKAVLA